MTFTQIFHLRGHHYLQRKPEKAAFQLSTLSPTIKSGLCTKENRGKGEGNGISNWQSFLLMVAKNSAILYDLDYLLGRKPKPVWGSDIVRLQMYTLHSLYEKKIICLLLSVDNVSIFRRKQGNLHVSSGSSLTTMVKTEHTYILNSLSSLCLICFFK